MPTIHNPERFSDEPRDVYQVRRMVAREAVQAMRLQGPFAPKPRSAPSSREEYRRNARQNPERWRARVTHTQGLAEWAARRAATTSQRRGAR